MQLLLAFSYSLMPDGSPGPHNLRLAELLRQTLSRPQQHGGFCAWVQWEIADALRLLSPDVFKTLIDARRLWVIPPPKFVASDFEDQQLWQYLKRLKTQAARQLMNRLASTEANLLEGLNGLLDKPKLYTQFPDLTLKPLERPRLGPLFMERRELPAAKDYPDGLGPYQPIRVNRLILDAVLNNDQILRPATYLSTKGVIDESIQAVDLDTLSEVVVLAHPAHLPRCLQQVESVLTQWAARPIPVIPGLAVELWPWDAGVAQQWCCSEAAWTAYEERIQAWAKRQGQN